MAWGREGRGTLISRSSSGLSVHSQILRFSHAPCRLSRACISGQRTSMKRACALQQTLAWMRSTTCAVSSGRRAYRIIRTHRRIILGFLLPLSPLPLPPLSLPLPLPLYPSLPLPPLSLSPSLLSPCSSLLVSLRTSSLPFLPPFLSPLSLYPSLPLTLYPSTPCFSFPSVLPLSLPPSPLVSLRPSSLPPCLFAPTHLTIFRSRFYLPLPSSPHSRSRSNLFLVSVALYPSPSPSSFPFTPLTTISSPSLTP